MSTAAAPSTEALLSAEEYARVAPLDQPSELVRGRIEIMNPPQTAHGYWCQRISRLLDEYVEQRQLGWVVSNDAGVRTERNPDTVRGADVAYYSYQRVPFGDPPAGYWPSPELAIEVRSPDDRWVRIHRKVSEYLEAGVLVVLVVDPGPRTVHVYSSDQPDELLSETDILRLPQIFKDFALPTARIFFRDPPTHLPEQPRT